MASFLAIVLLLPTMKVKKRMIVIRIKRKKSMFISGLYSIGWIIELKPRTKRRLKILEPTTFPIARSLCFLITARTEVTNSGRDVPRATIVRAINLSET